MEPKKKLFVLFTTAHTQSRCVEGSSLAEIGRRGYIHMRNSCRIVAMWTSQCIMLHRFARL